MAQYGAQAGAAIGTAIMPGVGTAVGALAGSFLDGAGGSSAAAMAPLNATAAVYGSGLDSSGWNVNFSGVQSAGSNKQGMPSTADTLGLAPGGLSPTVVIGAVIVIGLLLWKKSRSKA